VTKPYRFTAALETVALAVRATTAVADRGGGHGHDVDNGQKNERHAPGKSSAAQGGRMAGDPLTRPPPPPSGTSSRAKRTCQTSSSLLSHGTSSGSAGQDRCSSSMRLSRKGLQAPVCGSRALLSGQCRRVGLGVSPCGDARVGAS
jgi:hypothetical protein